MKGSNLRMWENFWGNTTDNLRVSTGSYWKEILTFVWGSLQGNAYMYSEKFKLVMRGGKINKGIHQEYSTKSIALRTK